MACRIVLANVASISKRNGCRCLCKRFGTASLLDVRRLSADVKHKSQVPEEPYEPEPDPQAPPTAMQLLWKKVRVRQIHNKDVVLDAVAARLFTLSSQVDYKTFINVFELEDVFISWYRITVLHLWLTQVKLQNEMDPQEFLRVRDAFYISMHEEYKKRLEDLSVEYHQYLSKKQNYEQLNVIYIESFLEYDEAVLSGDAQLAGALWRNLYEYSNVSPLALSRMVAYVRRQLLSISKVHIDDFMARGYDWSIGIRQK